MLATFGHKVARSIHNAIDRRIVAVRPLGSVQEPFKSSSNCVRRRHGVLDEHTPMHQQTPVDLNSRILLSS